VALPARRLAPKEKFRAVFTGGPVRPFASQQEVSDTLRYMALSVEDVFRCPKSDTPLTCGCTTGA
jgi:hypothetical protein